MFILLQFCNLNLTIGPNSCSSQRDRRPVPPQHPRRQPIRGSVQAAHHDRRSRAERAPTLCRVDREQNLTACLGILRVVCPWGPARVEAACQRGKNIGTRSNASIASISCNKLDRDLSPPADAGQTHCQRQHPWRAPLSLRRRPYSASPPATARGDARYAECTCPQTAPSPRLASGRNARLASMGVSVGTHG